VFNATCNPASGTASSMLTSQNGDQTVTAQSPFTVSNCPPPQPPPSGGGGSTPPQGGGGGPSGHPPLRPGHPAVVSASLREITGDHIALGLTVTAGLNAPGLKSFALALPDGLVAAERQGRHLRLVVRVSASGGEIQSVRLDHGKLVIVLRKAVARVKLHIRGLIEAAALDARPGHHALERLRIMVAVTDQRHAHTRMPVLVLRPPAG
jgi:hypothetical protein